MVHVLLFAANVLGYFRLALLAWSIYLFRYFAIDERGGEAVAALGLSIVLDAVDG